MHFDGLTNRRHAVSLRFGATLDIAEDGIDIASWPYDDLRWSTADPAHCGSKAYRPCRWRGSRFSIPRRKGKSPSMPAF